MATIAMTMEITMATMAIQTVTMIADIIIKIADILVPMNNHLTVTIQMKAPAMTTITTKSRGLTSQHTGANGNY